MKTISGAPLGLRVARSLSRSHIRGGDALTRLLLRLGRLDKIAQYQLGHVKFGVPVARIPWDFSDVANYEEKLIVVFCQAIAPLQNATLFDCGADIGTFSVKVCSRLNCIRRIVAFEPNGDTHEFLEPNLSNLAIPYQIISKAVSNFVGCGRLERPPENLTDHARYLIPGAGSLEVTTIDNMNIRGGDLAFKFDIEGGELEAIKGAEATIASARQCVITLEAHPAVAKRIGRDPGEALRFLESVRPFHFLVAETGQRPPTDDLILGKAQTEIWNVVAWTGDDFSL
jgi:FkbM family methyltransferase